MQENVIFKFEKYGSKSKENWKFFILGFIALFSGGFLSIVGLLMIGYGFHTSNKKSKVIVYENGFSIFDGNDTKNIAFERILGIKGELGQEMKIIYLKKPFYEYDEHELSNIHNISNSVIFNDELLEKDFSYVFDIIKKQFKNYVFEKYDNDLEQISNSPYLFGQISNDKLHFMKSKFWSGVTRKSIQLQYKDTVEMSRNKKSYIFIGRADKAQSNMSFEPQWKFLSPFEKCDTVNLTNAVLIQEILTKKYNIRFIEK